MKTRSLRRHVRQLEAEGKAVEAVDLVKAEASAMKTFASPAGVLTVPDFERQMAALRVGLELIKKHG
jgi:hypothetical protein